MSKIATVPAVEQGVGGKKPGSIHPASVGEDVAGVLAASQPPNPSRLKADTRSKTSSKPQPSEGAFGAGAAELSCRTRMAWW